MAFKKKKKVNFQQILYLFASMPDQDNPDNHL